MSISCPWFMVENQDRITDLPHLKSWLILWLQGCISVSMSFHQTSFCFVCSHLASGEKEGDELRRNLDVIEIIKNTQFSRICKSPCSRIPEKIMEHE